MTEARKGGPGIGLGVGMNSIETKEKQDTMHTIYYKILMMDS